MRRSSPARVLALVTLVGLAVSGSTGQSTAKEDAACCFTHPEFQGTCKVVPAQGETCASILEYLNTSGSTGKNYCSNSELRGRWAKVDCATRQ
jgi:hypothetical protein